VRVIKNKLTKMLEQLDRENRAEDLEKLGSGKLALAMREGDLDMGSLMAGQSSAMVCKVEPAEEIIRSMMDQAVSVMRGLATEN
jgi:enoyl-[acyl-carrier protein] reductase II